MFAPFRQELLLGSGGDFAAPDQQRLSLKQFRPELGQGVGKHVNAPALLGGNPGFEPQSGGIVYVPADHQRIFAVFSALRQDKRKYS